MLWTQWKSKCVGSFFMLSVCSPSCVLNISMRDEKLSISWYGMIMEIRLVGIDNSVTLEYILGTARAIFYHNVIKMPHGLYNYYGVC